MKLEEAAVRSINDITRSVSPFDTDQIDLETESDKVLVNLERTVKSEVQKSWPYVGLPCWRETSV